MALAEHALGTLATEYAAPKIRSVDGSHVACTVCPEAQARAAEDYEKSQKREAGALGEAIETRDPTKLLSKDFLLEVGEGGIPLGPLGNVAGAAIGFLVADNKAKKQTAAIIEQYGDEIAQQLGIPTEAVDARALLIAAKDNIGLRRAIAAIEDEKGAHPFINVAGLLGMVGGAVAGTFFPIPFVGTFLGGAVGYMAGQWAGEQAIGPEKEMNPLLQMDKLREKLAQAEPIDGRDVFALRVSQNPALAANIANQFGDSFYKLSPQDQHYAMQVHAELANQSMRDAVLCNNGGDLDDLMLGYMPEPVQEMAQLKETAGVQPQQSEQGSWAQRVGGPRAAQASFAQSIRAQQQQSAAAGPVLN